MRDTVYLILGIAAGDFLFPNTFPDTFFRHVYADWAVRCTLLYLEVPPALYPEKFKQVHIEHEGV
jgi:hypothetical protein